jgi:D-sedoheptulose 7-phosphate isomerase
MKDAIVAYLHDLKAIIDDVPVDRLREIIEVIIKTHKQGGKILVMGNGGSAATASHFACDLNKGVSGNPDKRLKVTCLNDNVPTLLAYANDISFEDIFAEQLKNVIEKKDLVIGISTSGASPNILKAIKFANHFGAATIGFSGGSGKLANVARYSLVVKSRDTQKIEDLHVVVVHIIMRVLSKELP